MLTFFAMLLYSSFLSCIWFRLGCALEYVSGDGGGQPTCAAPAHAYSSPFPHATWVLEDVHRGALKLNSPLSRYARALHFVVQTLFTIGYGDVRPTNTSEACMALFIILNGSLFYAFLISSLTSLLSNRDATTKLHRAESNSVLNYFRSRGVASELLEQLQSYSEFIFSQGRGVADEAVLRALPRPLCDSIRKGFIEKLLNVPFFRGLHECYGDSSRPCLDYLLTSSRLRMFTPGTPLVSLGQRRRVLYVVLYGRIEIRMHGSRCALLSLGDGDSLGELTVLLDVGAAEFVATAAEFTCVLEISRKSLLRAIKVAPALTSAECTPEALQQVWHEIQPRLEALYPTEPLLASPTHPACTAITPPKCCSFSDKDLHNPDSSAALLWVVSIAMGGCLQAAVLAAEQFKDKCRRVQGNIGNKTKRKVMDMLEQLDSGKFLCLRHSTELFVNKAKTSCLSFAVIDWWIVLPDSPVRPLWAAMTVLCIVYYLCAVPMR
jgi:CRP-like cAMP-binding protein